MSLDTWIVVDGATWDAIDPHRLVSVDIIETDEEGNQQIVGSYLTKAVTEAKHWHKVYRSGVTGYWTQSVYNVIGSQEDIEALLTELGNPTAYAWTQGDGLDSLDPYPTDPAPILALMKDHVEYDIDGNVTSTTPPTYEAPNWGHVFLGQKQRVFAGEFSDEFNEDFF